MPSAVALSDGSDCCSGFRAHGSRLTRGRRRGRARAAGRVSRVGNPKCRGALGVKVGEMSYDIADRCLMSCNSSSFDRPKYN